MGGFEKKGKSSGPSSARRARRHRPAVFRRWMGVSVDGATSHAGGKRNARLRSGVWGDRRRGGHAGTDARQPPGGRPPPPRRASSLPAGRAGERKRRRSRRSRPRPGGLAQASAARSRRPLWWAGELDSIARPAPAGPAWPSRGPHATTPPVCVDLAISQTGVRRNARLRSGVWGDRRRGTRAGTGAVPDARPPPGGRPPPPRRASSLLRPRRGPGRTARRASGLSPLDGRVRGRRDFTDGSPAQRAVALGCMGGIVADRLRRVERRACSALGEARAGPPGALRASPAGRAGRGERRRSRPPPGGRPGRGTPLHKCDYGASFGVVPGASSAARPDAGTNAGALGPRDRDRPPGLRALLA